jgi:RuvB-like protein 1
MKATTSASATTSAPAHNAPLPPTSPSARSSRIAPHSHIKGLGLTPEGFASVDGAGFIGQTNAREVKSMDLFPTTTNSHGKNKT